MKRDDELSDEKLHRLGAEIAAREAVIAARQAARQAAAPFRARMLERFPTLYAELRAAATARAEPIAREGFAIAPGWRGIVERVSERLAALVEQQPAEARASFRVVQVKEKFGLLRIYLDEETPEMVAAISEAAAESVRMCETCGSPGKMRVSSRGYVCVRCTACWAFEAARRANDHDLECYIGIWRTSCPTCKVLSGPCIRYKGPADAFHPSRLRAFDDNESKGP